jgi:ketosteroid isomerase-like protein
MGADPTTPEALDALLEDAFVLRDTDIVSSMFEPGAVVVTGCEFRGAKRITEAVTAMWERGLTYLAEPRRVVQARDTALVVGDQAISVMRRTDDGVWRYTIALLNLDRNPTKGGTS